MKAALKITPSLTLVLVLLAAGCSHQDERTGDSSKGNGKKFPVLYFDTARVLEAQEGAILNGEIQEPSGSDNSARSSFPSSSEIQEVLKQAKGVGLYFELHPNSLIIRGSVPSRAERDQIVAMARKLGAPEIIDRLETAEKPRI